MLHRLCGPPSITLSFSLATVLPRRGAYRVSIGTAGIDPHYTKHPSFTARTTRVSNPVCSPGFRALCVRTGPESRLRHRCSSQYLRISPLHWEFHSPLPASSKEVSNAIPRLSRGILRSTFSAAYAPFTPNNSEQRLPPPYYRGCWHGVSRGFLWWYSQAEGLLTPLHFFPLDRPLRSEDLHRPRGVAGSGFRPLSKIPHCCLP